jgi:uncharacterized membrane protein YadS
MSTLVAAGCSICGVTAISALAPIIKAKEQEMAFAVANVVLFGTLGMLLLPYVANALFPISQQVRMLPTPCFPAVCCQRPVSHLPTGS